MNRPLGLESIPLREWLLRRDAVDQLLRDAVHEMRAGSLAAAERAVVEATLLLSQLSPLA